MELGKEVFNDLIESMVKVSDGWPQTILVLERRKELSPVLLVQGDQVLFGRSVKWPNNFAPPGLSNNERICENPRKIESRAK